MASFALVLFDIDGTLLRRSGPHHRQALEEAIRRVTGLHATTEGIATQGMLDRDIITIMMQQAGATRAHIRASMGGVMAAAETVYVETCPDLRSRVCVGAEVLLASLKERGAVAGLVPGNLTRIAWRKMEAAGLAGYFSLGAFADMGRTRSGLARLAIRQARRESLIHRKAKISLIGDHQNDIEAAKRNRIQSIAVATGISTTEELAACAPDHLVADMRQLDLSILL